MLSSLPEISPVSTTTAQLAAKSLGNPHFSDVAEMVNFCVACEAKGGLYCDDCLIRSVARGDGAFAAPTTTITTADESLWQQQPAQFQSGQLQLYDDDFGAVNGQLLPYFDNFGAVNGQLLPPSNNFGAVDGQLLLPSDDFGAVPGQLLPFDDFGAVTGQLPPHSYNFGAVTGQLPPPSNHFGAVNGQLLQVPRFDESGPSDWRQQGTPDFPSPAYAPSQWVPGPPAELAAANVGDGHRGQWAIPGVDGPAAAPESGIEHHGSQRKPSSDKRKAQKTAHQNPWRALAKLLTKLVKTNGAWKGERGLRVTNDDRASKAAMERYLQRNAALLGLALSEDGTPGDVELRMAGPNRAAAVTDENTVQIHWLKLNVIRNGGSFPGLPEEWVVRCSENAELFAHVFGPTI